MKEISLGLGENLSVQSSPELQYALGGELETRSVHTSSIIAGFTVQEICNKVFEIVFNHSLKIFMKLVKPCWTCNMQT